jgi:hypothetical protein
MNQLTVEIAEETIQLEWNMDKKKGRLGMSRWMRCFDCF